MSSYVLMNFNNLGAMTVSSVVKVFYLRGDVHFIKYCKETTGEIRGLISLCLLMNINDLGAMDVSSVV